MKVRVSSAFVTKFELELDRLMDSSIPDAEYWMNGVSVPRKLGIEEFLEAMAPDLARVLKHQLLECLLADAAGIVPETHSAAGTESAIDTNRLDC